MGFNVAYQLNDGTVTARNVPTATTISGTWPAVGTSLFELTVRLALPTAMVGGLVQAALALAARSSPVFRAWGGGVVLLTFLVPAVWGLSFRSTAGLLEHAVEGFCDLLRGFPAGL